jgi:CRISPR-associated protein Csm1
MPVDEKTLNAALAGLLHDIGKLEQRARADPWNPAPGTEGEGQPVHATWSIYFAQSYVPKKYRAAALAGAYHHRPEKSPAEDRSLSALVSLADKLSAGERSDLEEKARPLPRQMVSIFDRLNLEGKSNQGGWHYLPLERLALREESIFPAGEISKDQQEQAYDSLRRFLEEASRTEIEDGQVYLENLLNALQQAAWCAPSAYYHSIPDVSLYDHSRMTAALAACMCELHPDKIAHLLGAVQREFAGQDTPTDRELLAGPAALLVGGDISGIQDFIYTISSKRAARTLRGRSFYLQLLSEAVLRFTLDQLGLPYTNVIYSGGGHFFLLAPVSAQERLPGLRRAVTQKLLKHHDTSLYLAIGSAVVPFSGFRLGEFPRYWDEMHRDLAQAKLRRYIELGSEMYTQIFEPKEFGGNPDSTCSICGADYRRVSDWSDDEDQPIKVCSFCSSFAGEIGRPLPKAGFLALGFGPAEAAKPGTAASALSEFGLYFQFLQDDRQPVNLPGAQRVTIWALQDPKQGWPESPNAPAAQALHYTINRTPPLSFDQLQKKVRRGFERLGVLRLDVDDLGDLFKFGLGQAATLARLSTLSFQVALYFEGWVKQLCETGELRDLIYAVYAGGDDVFLIGPWDLIPELALKIRGDFRRYTSEHPALHLSGGMAFIDGKYPVYQAARDAAQAERQAKSAPGKDAFSFLGQAWKWQDFESVLAKRGQVIRLVADKAFDAQSLEGPQKIIQVLRQLALDEAEAARDRGRPVYGRWLWIGPYQLKRMAERQKDPQLARAIDSLREELDENNYREINQWGAAARWAQLLTRKKHEAD